MFQANSIGKEANGFHDTSFKCDADICEHSNVLVMLPPGHDHIPMDIRAHDEETDRVGSIRGDSQMVTPPECRDGQDVTQERILEIL